MIMLYEATNDNPVYAFIDRLGGRCAAAIFYNFAHAINYHYVTAHAKEKFVFTKRHSQL